MKKSVCMVAAAIGEKIVFGLCAWSCVGNRGILRERTGRCDAEGIGVVVGGERGACGVRWIGIGCDGVIVGVDAVKS